MEKNKKWSIVIRSGLTAIALVYLLVLFKIVLFKSGTDSDAFRNVQYVPFVFIGELIRNESSIDVLMKNVMGNCAIFVPIGILIPTFFRTFDFKKTVISGLVCSLVFEVVQYLTGFGVTDVDDLLLNTLGTVIGAGVFFGVFCKCKKRIRTDILAFVFLMAFGGCGVLALWLYHPSALPAQIEIRNQEFLNGVDEDSYDISAKCLELQNGTVSLEEESVEAGSGFHGKIQSQYILSEGASIIAKEKTFQYSPNGNIQKQTINYRAVSEQEAAILLKSDKHRFQENLWIDESGECCLMILTVVEN